MCWDVLTDRGLEFFKIYFYFFFRSKNFCFGVSSVQAEPHWSIPNSVVKRYKSTTILGGGPPGKIVQCQSFMSTFNLISARDHFDKNNNFLLQFHFELIVVFEIQLMNLTLVIWNLYEQHILSLVRILLAKFMICRLKNRKLTFEPVKRQQYQLTPDQQGYLSF